MATESDMVLREDVLSQCEAALGYTFQRKDLLKTCLTHASGARHRLDSNERLEFLGDAVLGVVVCELLFQRYPQATEGDLTRLKSILVSRLTCARISDRLGCTQYLLLGKGMGSLDQVPVSVRAAVFESLIAGVYLDGGFEATRELIKRFIEPELDACVEWEQGKNFKSLLQQHVQRSLGTTPLYRVLDEKGPDHSKCFKVAAQVGSQYFAAAWGPTKKEAEQRAAHNALYEIQGRAAPHAADY